MLKPYKKVNSKILFTNDYVTYYEDDFIAGNGKAGKYYFEKRRSGVLIIGVEDNTENFILIREYKYPIKDFTINAPMGGVNNNEDIEKAARREFMEETGYTSKESLIHLGTWHTYPGRSADLLISYFLPNCIKKHTITGGEETEETEVILIPKNEIWDWINEKLENANTVLALIKACKYLKIYPNK